MRKATKVSRPSPQLRHELTIDSVRDASDPETYARAVDRWARSTWEAYAPLHPVARDWYERARSGGR